MKKISILLLLVIFVFSSCSTNKGAKPVEDAVVVSQETVATVAPREEAPLSEVVVIEDPVEATVAEAPVVDEAVSEVGGADAPAAVVETVKEVVSDPVATEPSVVATPVVEAVAEPVEVVEAEAEAVEAVESVEAVEAVEAEAEPVAAVEPAPIQEPEPVVEETVIYGELELFGEVASISMGETKAEIEYPENIVYESDIAAFIDSVGPAYKDYINGVTYRIFPGGKAEIYYPAISKEFRFEILRVLEKEIFNYIDKLSTPEVPVDSFREPTPETPDPAVEEVPAAVAASAPEAPASAPAVTEVVPVEETQPVADTPAPVIEPVIVETVEKETPAPVVAVPVIDSDMDESMLSMLGIFIVIVVLYTAAVAIRSANKMPLSKGLSFVIAILFTALSIVVSTIVSGYSQIYLLYLILLFTFFVFRSKGAKN